MYVTIYTIVNITTSSNGPECYILPMDRVRTNNYVSTVFEGFEWMVSHLR